MLLFYKPEHIEPPGGFIIAVMGFLRFGGSDAAHPSSVSDYTERTVRILHLYSLFTYVHFIHVVSTLCQSYNISTSCVKL